MAIEPDRLGEPFAMETHGESRRKKPDLIAEAERALKADAPKANCVERTLVGVAEPTERCEVLGLEILAVVAEQKLVAFNKNASPGCACVICILKKLGDNVTRALHLLEQMVPRRSKFRVGFKLIPALSRSLSDFCEIRGRLHHAGS
jgi:hypothetical protein